MVSVYEKTHIIRNLLKRLGKQLLAARLDPMASFSSISSAVIKLLGLGAILPGMPPADTELYLP